VLLTPPPYRQPERLALVHSLGSDGQPSRQGWAALQWTDWQRQAKSLEGVAAYEWTFNFLIGNDGSESMQGMVVTREYFNITGLQPILGRSFVEAEAGGQDSASGADRLRSLAAQVQWRPPHHRQNDPHQPVGHASDGNRRHAARRALSTVAGRRAGTEL